MHTQTGFESGHVTTFDHAHILENAWKEAS